VDGDGDGVGEDDGVGDDDGEDGGLEGDGGALERLGADFVGARGVLAGVDGARDVVGDGGGRRTELELGAADTGGSKTSGGATIAVGDGRVVVRTSFGFGEWALVGAASGEGFCLTGVGAL
jgi:hypothetical protein